MTANEQSDERFIFIYYPGGKSATVMALYNLHVCNHYFQTSPKPYGQPVKLHVEHSWVLETNVSSVHLGHMNQYVLHARIG